MGWMDILLGFPGILVALAVIAILERGHEQRHACGRDLVCPHG